MKALALFACLGLLVACGGEEAHDHSTDKAPTTEDANPMTGKTPAKTDAPSGGAEMRMITVKIDGMT
ncbi:MAG: hypothetical protein ACYTHK_10345 [Planctomycetota bacterium]|jgi:hypothetical protein